MFLNINWFIDFCETRYNKGLLLRLNLKAQLRIPKKYVVLEKNLKRETEVSDSFSTVYTLLNVISASLLLFLKFYNKLLINTINIQSGIWVCLFFFVLESRHNEARTSGFWSLIYEL